jgi:pimeloyl-ACP methyl ester carboxylesterase
VIFYLTSSLHYKTGMETLPEDGIDGQPAAPEKQLTISYLTKSLALTAVLILTAAGGLRAQAPQRVLQGIIKDAHNAALPGVRCTLQKAGLTAESGTDGSFTLAVPASAMPGEDGTLDIIEMTKPGLRTRWIRVTEASFTQPVNVVIEPLEVGADNFGFIAFMPRNATIINQLAQIPADPPYAVTAEQLRTGLQQTAKLSATEIPDDDVAFYAWVPKETRKLKAAFLISLHGIGTIDSPVLRKFAAKNDIALVGVIGDPIQRGCYPLELMDQHMARLGQIAGHPELADVPVLTFGHSNGTGFATVYASDRADRLIGWISYHSGYAWQNLMPNLEQAPGLVMHGQLDALLDKHSQDKGVMEMRRTRNAPVAMMLEGSVDHAPVDRDATWEFVVQFCEAAMRARLGDNGKLKPVNIEQGWLGGIYDRTKAGQQLLPIAPFAEFKGDKATANWLPDEQFAKVWRTYGNTDPRKPGK